VESHPLSTHYGMRFIEINSRLTRFVVRWFSHDVAHQIIFNALRELMSEAYFLRRTNQGPYAEYLKKIEFQMRVAEYSNSCIVPLGLNRMFPIPAWADIDAFTKLYGSLRDLFGHAMLHFESVEDVALIASLSGFGTDISRGLYGSDITLSAGYNAVNELRAALDDVNKEGDEICRRAFELTKREEWSATDWYPNAILRRGGDFDDG
jgi:hypothetical protein